MAPLARDPSRPSSRPGTYLVDALAAERRRGQHFQEGLALVPREQGSSAQERWPAKRITPILYDPRGEHGLLHQTLQAWARVWKGGLESKANLVEELVNTDPETAPPDTVSRLCWAVSDPSGAMAQRLARTGTRSSLKWLAHFEKEGILSARSVGGDHQICLVDEGRATRGPIQLDPVRYWIARWLTTHKDDPDLLRWIVARGAHLHRTLIALLRQELNLSPPTVPAMGKVWSALTGSIPFGSGDTCDGFGLSRRLKTAPWSPLLRMELLRALDPCVTVRPAWGVPSEEARSEVGQDQRQETRSALRVSHLLSFECDLQVGSDKPLLLEDLRARADYQSILADIALDLTSLLRRALDIQSLFAAASPDEDLSYLDRPSIPPHEQNHELHGWTLLIELLSEAFRALWISDRDAATALIQAWADLPYPTFRRLVLHVASAGAVPPAKLLNSMLRDGRRWLWHFMIQVELFAVLPRLWETLSSADQKRLSTAILEGPPREMCIARLPSGEWEQLRDHSIWERLARIARGGGVLPEDGAARLQLLERTHPEWSLTGAEQEDFPAWTTSRWGYESDYSVPALLARSDADLVRILQEHTHNRDGLLQSWGDVARQEPKRTMTILGTLLDDTYLDGPVWASALRGLAETMTDTSNREAALALIPRLPDALIGRVLPELAAVLRASARQIGDSLRPRLLGAIDDIWQRALLWNTPATREPLTDALNHPAGVLAEAILEVLRSRPLRRGEGLPDDIRLPLETFLEAAPHAGRLARVMICSRLALLHAIDEIWVRQRLIARFDWAMPDEALGAWQGYLWSPRLDAPLAAAIKPYFLATFDHFAELGDRFRQQLAALLAFASIEIRGVISADEVRDSLCKLDESGRATVAHWLDRKLEGAGDQAASLWRDAIGPWHLAAWPREVNLRDAASSTNLALAATQAGSAFPEAVTGILGLLGHVRSGDRLIRALFKTEAVQSHPSWALSLVCAVTPDNPARQFSRLVEFTDRIAQVAPALRDTPDFRRLRDAALRGNA